ncbi:MAG: serine/threonine-protein kinase [Thermoanaerobaculaceae bacterium]|nr:serine/threonine-protein kinase [Thermoanaerobaculaceae bacterium]TAM49006.1 MAG: serine/threonine protein kinase [Acidobacteriota bacterium]
MPFGPGVALTPALGVLVTRGSRSLTGLAAALLLLWLNLWWLVPLLGPNALNAALPSFLAAAHSALIMTAGHLLAVALLLAAGGLFSPAAGSPAELAVRSARRGDHRAAGEYWLEAGRPRRASRSFLRARAWGRAAELARTRGQLGRAAELLQREGGDSLAAAGQLYARAGRETEANEVWLRYGQHLIEHGRPELAVEPFARAGDVRRALHAVELALEGRRLGAAQAEVAIRTARDGKRPALAAAVALACGRQREAADLFLAADQPLDAARAFEQAGETIRAADALRLAGRTEDAARLRGGAMAAAGKVEEALQEYRTAGMAAEAAAALERLGRHREAFDAYRAAGLPREAARLARERLDPREAAALYAELEEWGEAGAAWEAAGEFAEAARCHEQAGDLLRAEEALARGGLTAERAHLLARMGRVEEGFVTLYGSGDMRAAWELLSGYGGTFPALAEPLAALGSWLAEQGETTAAISAVQRAVAGLPLRREVLPAAYTLAELLERHGDVRAAEGAWRRVVEFDYAFRDAGQRLQRVAAQRAANDAASSGAPPAPGREPAAAGVTDPAARYVLEQELGRGGMGVVYRARDSRLGRTVAIKILNPRQHTPEAIRRFEREARAAAALSHPGIVHIYDFDRGFSSFYISMEFVSGPTLLQLIREEPPFVRRHLLALMRQIIDAASYAHERHVVHRDLKPANMILADRRQVKILDFGIARRLDELDLSASGATGTPFYMAPEQVLGEAPDERTDIYALGVTFFQMATGTLPFATGNILRAHLEQPAPDPQALAPDLEPAIAHLILRCLAKDPDSRPRDGAALLAALTAIERGVAT